MEGAVEVTQHRGPSNLAIGYAVELLLHIRSEVVVDNRLELRLEVVVHDHAYIRRSKAALLAAIALRYELLRDLLARECELHNLALLAIAVLLNHITTVDDGGDGGGIC